MPHDHHAHQHQTAATAALASGDRRVVLAIAVNILLTLVQIVAGVISGSLALIADAIHNLSDALSLVVAFLARRIGRRPADARMTFGYGRAEVVAALINYTTLIVIAVYLAAEGVRRLFDPQPVEGWIVVLVAGIALIIDTATALLIHRLSKDSVNMRAAFLHNVADALGSVAVIVAGIVILLYDWRLIDPLVTLGISAYILWHAGQGILPVIRILMLASPEEPGLEELLRGMRGLPGVLDVHHVHYWRMQEHEAAIEAHVVIAPGHAPDAVKRAVKSYLETAHSIAHSVLELESPGAACAAPRVIGH